MLQADVEELRARLEEKNRMIDKKTQNTLGAVQDRNRMQSELAELKDHMDIKDRKINVLQRKVCPIDSYIGASNQLKRHTPDRKPRGPAQGEGQPGGYGACPTVRHAGAPLQLGGRPVQSGGGHRRQGEADAAAARSARPRREGQGGGARAARARADRVQDEDALAGERRGEAELASRPRAGREGPHRGEAGVLAERTGQVQGRAGQGDDGGGPRQRRLGGVQAAHRPHRAGERAPAARPGTLAGMCAFLLLICIHFCSRCWRFVCGVYAHLCVCLCVS